MQHLRTTPQTLPCGEEDLFYSFHEDDSSDNDSICVNISDNSCTPIAKRYRYQESSSFLDTSKYAPQRKDLKEIDGADKQQKGDYNILSCKNLSLHGGIKEKRRKYSSKFLSRRNLSKIFKAAIQSSSTGSPSPQRPRRDQTTGNSLNEKDRFYHSIEEEDEERDFYDDRSSTISLPVLSPLSWKKRKSRDLSSSVSTSAAQLPRESKLKWNRLLQTDTLVTFKSLELSPTSEMTSSSSVASSIASYNSAPATSRRFDNGDAYHFDLSSPRTTTSHHRGFFRSIVHEEEEEDTDMEDDDHPSAGSLAFAIGRGEC